MGQMGGKTGEWGEVPLGQLFFMMSPGCMQREVEIGRRRAEIFAQNSKIKPAPPRFLFFDRATGLAHWEAVARSRPQQEK